MNREPNALKVPKSIRAMEIVVGSIALILAGLVLAFPAFAAVLVISLLSISLIFIGIEGILVGAGGKGLSRGQRAFRLGIGIVAVALSVLVLAFPAAAIISSIALLSVGLLFMGASEIAKGIANKQMPSWARALYVGVGALTVVLSVLAVVFPILGFLTLYYLIAFNLVIIGATYIVAGVAGVSYASVKPAVRSDSKKKWESDAA